MNQGLISTWRIAGAVALATLTAASAPVQSGSNGKQSRGFVVTEWDNALYETKFADECPAGFAESNDEFWWRGLARADRDKLTNGGLIQQVDRGALSVKRGPKGEDICWNPTVVADPPMRVVKGKLGYGFNLDGTADGHATAKSCAHEKFTSPDGTPAVDNQLYRIMGCVYGFRHDGVASGQIANESRRSTGRGVILMEISGSDDLRESDNVEVTFYRAVDLFTLDGTGEVLPYASFRIDMNGAQPRYGAHVHGKIHDGVLVTEPADVTLPNYGQGGFAELLLRDMTMRLDLTAAERKITGLVGGYMDFDQWWAGMRKSELLMTMGDWSCPAAYVAGKQLADGYPDPKTGACTALSTAYKVKAVPAFIVHEGQSAQR